MERPSPEPSKPSKPSIVEAIALIIVGLVVFVPSGLCTGAIFLNEILDGNWISSLGPVAIGGPFMFGGGVLLWNGYKRMREYSQESDKS